MSAVSALFAQVNGVADVLAICGDITDHGLPDEATMLAREVPQSLRLPAVAVLGNHDYEAGRAVEVRTILRDSGIQILDGDAWEIHGIGFAGTKGFCGGFGPRALGSWGEPMIKQFVQETIAEALKLETALFRLRMPPRD